MLPPVLRSCKNALQGVPLFLFAALITACSSGGEKDVAQKGPEAAIRPMFRMHTGDSIGLPLRNDLREDADMNYFVYNYMYHSGGAATGDVDGDDLPDVFICTNRNGARLYHNKGGLKFEDISDKAGINVGQAWCTGTTMVDINADGWLDIYVCISGPSTDPDQLRDKLFVNNGNGTFAERAAELGLADAGHATQAYFHDLDADGDLDLYLVATRNDFNNNDKVATYTIVPTSPNSDRLYVNDGTGHFADQTVAAGVLNHAWGLGAAIGDMNGDGLNDIYVANDFLEPDFLYASNGDGTFTDRILGAMKHICFYGMGVDRADYNNDGLADICVLDMTPPDHLLNKTNMASMRPKQFFQMVEFGWNHQYMANTLQLNNGNGTYSDVAHLAGVDRTDWSWAPLFVDLDNDGWKDLYVTNGMWRDVTNNDYKMRLKELTEKKGTTLDFDEVMALIPRHAPENIMFRNNGDLTFKRSMDDWGYHHASFSTGASYADLDGDGDMDLVVCDVGNPPMVVENLARQNGTGAYLQVRLKGGANNPFAIGSHATLYTDKGLQTLDLALARGFQSSMEPLLHFGLGDARIDSLHIDWYDGTRTAMKDVKADQRLTVDINSSEHAPAPKVAKPQTWFADVAKPSGLEHTHTESEYDDFATEILLPHRQSQHGPGISVADVNGDGLDDLFTGAGAGTSPVLFTQNTGGRFQRAASQPWSAFKQQEVVGSHFFDADGDGDMDLYTAAGSTEFGRTSELYQDRLYLNDGHGAFTHAADALPAMPTSTLSVASADVDGDGDLDLFVGGRNEPGAYPAAPKSYLLVNEGGKFTDDIAARSPALERPGMVTDAIFTDLNADKQPDLLLCGEWMPVRAFLNDKGSFTDATTALLDSSLVGWWYDLEVGDLDDDGDMDIVAGNVGLNNKFHPSKEKPLEIYMNDLDQTGTNDIVLAKHKAPNDPECQPVRGRECSSEQMPFIKEKFKTYQEFAEANLDLLYGHDKLAASVHYTATDFHSMIWRNEGGKFVPTPLPMAAQVSPIRGCVIIDVNGDGSKDLVVAGNMWGSEVETTRYDAGIGCVLLNDGKGGYSPVPVTQSGFFADHDARELALVRIGRNGTPHIAVVNDDGPLQLFAPVSTPSGGQKLAAR